MAAEPQVPDFPTGRALLGLVAAGAIVIAAAAAGIALAVDRPFNLLLQPIGIWGLLGLVAASLLCTAAGRLRGPVSYEGLERLVSAWVVFQLACFLAFMILLIAWLAALAAGRTGAEMLVQAALLPLISGLIASLIGKAGFNLRRAIRGPARR